MIEYDFTSNLDPTFCKNKIDSFEKNFLSTSSLPINDQRKFLEVKNLLIYQHPSYDVDLIQTLKIRINDSDEIKIQKLVSFYLSETAQNIWWAQTGYRHQALINKYKPILTDNLLKTITLNPIRWSCLAISDALKLIIFCPERAGAYVNFQENPSLENINQVINSGFVFALIAILLEHSISIGLINYHISSKYTDFFKNPNITTWYRLIKENPGIIGFLSISLGFTAIQVLKLVINWECHYSKIMSGNIKEAGQVFAKHPSLLGLLTLSFKELGYNPHAHSEYSAFLKKPSAETWCNLIKSNPGVIGSLSVSLGYPMTRLLKATINWECHYSKIMSGNIKEAGQVFAEHPSLLGLLALSLKELGYNPHAHSEYSAFFENPSAETWHRLVKANPGLIGGSFSSLFYFSNTVARKTFIDPTGMKISLFEFLTEDQFTALKML